MATLAASWDPSWLAVLEDNQVRIRCEARRIKESLEMTAAVGV
jgi:hypothetical protein